MKRMLILTVFITATALVACGSDESACAAPAPRAPSGGGGGAKSPSAPSGAKGGASSGGAKTQSGGGAGKPASPPPKNNSQNKASSASKPNSRPTAEDAATAKSQRPSTVTRNGSYYSNVTGNTYVFHDYSYYRSPGYIVDIYDPYNPYNYWSFPASPFYGQPYRMRDTCDGADHVEQKQEVNITVDGDGKVTDVKDAPAGTTGTTALR